MDGARNHLEVVVHRPKTISDQQALIEIMRRFGPQNAFGISQVDDGYQVESVILENQINGYELVILFNGLATDVPGQENADWLGAVASNIENRNTALSFSTARVNTKPLERQM
jgi:hypothetical protein